jgi:hypothetical protein
VQWFAVPVLALATYGVGRRLGLARPPALWSASLVPIFPVVIVQSWSSFTDLVFASFAVSAVYFTIGALGAELVPLGLAVGLAVGTKLLGPLFAPLFALILVVSQPPRRWLAAGAAAVAGAGVAAIWFLRTQLETGDPVGNGGAGVQSREVAPVVTTFERLSVEIFDLSGAAGRDIWLYGITALALGVAAVALPATGRSRGAGGLIVAAVLVAVAPFAVEVAGKGYARLGLTVGDALGREDLVDQLRDWRPSEVADGAYSWFGPVGAVIALGGVPVAVAEVRRRRLDRTAIVLAASPLLAMGLVSLAIAYQRYQGRYFVATFALCAVVWGGLALRQRWIAAAIAGVAVTTVLLALVNSLGKPPGVGLLRGDPGRSVWSMPRWEQQGILRSTAPERDEVMTMRFVEERVPEDASLGLSLVLNSFTYPYFGRDLARTLTIVEEGVPVPAGIDWLVASPGRELLGCRDAWERERLGPYGWSVWRRTGQEVCATARQLGR